TLLLLLSFSTRRSSDLLLLLSVGCVPAGKVNEYASKLTALIDPLKLKKLGECGAILGCQCSAGPQRDLACPWLMLVCRLGSNVRSEEHTSELQSRGHLV